MGYGVLYGDQYGDGQAGDQIQFLNLYPINGSSGVDLDTLVSFTVTSVTAGISLTAINVGIDGVDAIVAGVFQAGFHGPYSSITPNGNGFDVVVDSEIDYQFNSTVVVLIEAETDTGSVGQTTLSFYTEATVPYSDEWSCFDVDGIDMSNILFMTGVDINRGTPWIEVDGHNDLVLSSDDGSPSIMTIELPIGEKFSCEVNFKPKMLPPNLDDLDNSRLFIAVFDEQGNTGGLLVSKSGLAIVSSYGSTVTPIFGSQVHIDEGDEYHTLRMVVDGSINVMDLYITKTADLPEVGHQLRYTSAAPVTPAASMDSVKFEILGMGTNGVQINLDSIRVACNELIIPNQRPVANAGQDQTAVIGSSIQLDGLDSYDPEKQPLSFRWTLISAPIGSGFRQDGTEGYALDDGDADGFTDILRDDTGPWSLDNSPSLQPGDALLINGTLYEVSDLDWVLNATTGKYDRGGTFTSDKLRVTTDAIPDDLMDVPWVLYHQSTFWFDRTLPQPVYVPDIQGLHRVQLVVNDGQLDSLPAEQLVNINDSNVPFGCVPDLNFVWDFLSDAWNLYDDRDPVTVMWSGFAQVASSLLMTAWQYDYGKSLVDVQRTFQRRWIDYRPLLEEPSEDRDEAVVRIIRGGLIGSDITGGAVFTGGETFTFSRDGGQDVTVTFSAGTLTPAEVARTINLSIGEQLYDSPTAQILDTGSSLHLSLEYAGLFVVRSTGTANSIFGYSSTEDEQNDLRGEEGKILEDLSSTRHVRAFVAQDSGVDFRQDGLVRSDLLVFEGEGFEVQKVAASTLGTTQLSMLQDLPDTLDDPIPEKPWLLSSSVTSANTNFTDEMVRAGDIVILELRKEGTTDVDQVRCEVTGARNNVVGFNPKTLLERLSGDLTGYEISLLGVLRTKRLPVSDLVMRIPRLQEVVLDPPGVLEQNQDFFIVDGSKHILFQDDLYGIDNPPPDILWAEVTFLDNRPMIENNFGKAVDFKVEDLETRSDDLDYLSAVRGLWYAFFNGPAVRNVRIGTQILLGLPFAETDGVVDDVNLQFNAQFSRMLIRDKADTSIVRSYFIPRKAAFEDDEEFLIEDNPDTGVPYVVGDEVTQFSPLSKGIEIVDYVNDPQWWTGIQNQELFLEVLKYFTFQMRADVDTFSITNLVFAIDFVKKIKPHYTFPLWFLEKRLDPDLISVTDFIEMSGTLYLYDNPACGGVAGAYRWDDYDEAGNPNWAYDGAPHSGSSKPEFLYDKLLLCPEDVVEGYFTTVWAGGVPTYDWIWAFDDGGGNDLVPLTGPSGLVGPIKFDTALPAGTYTRGKTL